ncbi:MAG: YcxB family protein [Myxococcales bacterium]|nr:YcxB family protein [Myxococcales bacterium]
MSAYREEATVRASWVLEGPELDHLYRAEVGAWRHATRLAVAGTVAGAGLVYVLTLPPFHALFSFVMMGLASVWLARVLTRTQSYEKSYGASWEDRRHVELEATEDSLRLADRITDERVAWELVLFWREDDEAFHVYTAPSFRRVIPKRALPSAEQKTTLRRLLADGVKPGGEAAIRAAQAYAQVPTALYAVALSLVVGSVIEGFARLLS